MEELTKENEKLKEDLRKMEKELHMAAVFGKQLLETKSELTESCAKLKGKIDTLTQENSAKCENLEQEIHSLQSRLDAKEQILRNQMSENETLKDELAVTSTDLKQILKASNEASKKIIEFTKENEVLEGELKKATEEKNNWEKKALLLEEQVKEAQQCFEESIVGEDSNEELQKLQMEIHQLLKSKQELEQSLCDTKISIESAKAKQQKMEGIITKLQEEIESKDYEIASYSSALEKSKSVTADLEEEIEILKLQQTDVNLRGNSVFAEVEDRRSAVEKELLKITAHYEVAVQKNKIAMQNQQALKQQLVLLRASNQRVDAAYTQKLEEDLSQARVEIQTLTSHIAELQKTVDRSTMNLSSNDQSESHNEPDGNHSYDYLKIMLKESQMDFRNLKKELHSVCLMKAAESDKLLQCQKKLFHVEKNNQSLKEEVLHLRMKVEEHSKKNKDYIKPLKDISDLQQNKNIPFSEQEKTSFPAKALQPRDQIQNMPIPGDSAVKGDEKHIDIGKTFTLGGEKKETELSKIDFNSLDEKAKIKIRKHCTVAPVINVVHDENVASCAQQ